MRCRYVLSKGKGDKRVCVPVTKRRPDLPGQREPYAATSSGTSRTAQSQISRPPAHIRHHRTAKRSGHQDSVGYEASKDDEGNRVQEIEIFYRFVGNID